MFKSIVSFSSFSSPLLNSNKTDVSSAGCIPQTRLDELDHLQKSHLISDQRKWKEFHEELQEEKGSRVPEHVKFAVNKIKTRKLENEKRGGGLKESAVEYPDIQQLTADNQHTVLADVVTPLWRIPYKKQLYIKYKLMEKILRNLLWQLREAKVNIQHCYNNLPCILSPVIPSPVTENYRNKDEFCVNYGIDGNPKTLGFYIGSPSTEQGCVCVSPEGIWNIKDSHITVMKLFQEYIRSSPLMPCFDFSGAGHWRNLIVRSTRTGKLQASITFHPQHMLENELSEEKNNIVRFFTEGPGREAQLTSLYFQACPHTRCLSNTHPFELLHGSPHLVDTLSDMKFRISPDAFFQLNPAAAEVLCNTVHGMLQLSKNTTILDICCGAGALSLVLAPHCRSVLGVDIVKEAIIDAKINAKLNNINNAEFVAGKAEKVLPNLMPEFSNSSDLLAIVNPPRAGLHRRVIHSIRHCRSIQRVVYISCKQDGAVMENFVDLCKPIPGKTTGKPFYPKLAVPIDLFPHTDHCELVILFER